VSTGFFLAGSPAADEGFMTTTSCASQDMFSERDETRHPRLLPGSADPSDGSGEPARGGRASIEPPSFNWLLALALTVATLGAFGLGMSVWQSRWARKVDADSRATFYLVLAVAATLVAAGFDTAAGSPLVSVGRVAAALFYLCSGLSVKRTMEEYYEEECGGRTLSVMATFLLGHVYLQYWFNQVEESRAASAEAGSRRAVA
jgi:hypothetical protein